MLNTQIATDDPSMEAPLFQSSQRSYKSATILNPTPGILLHQWMKVGLLRFRFRLLDGDGSDDVNDVNDDDVGDGDDVAAERFDLDSFR